MDITEAVTTEYAAHDVKTPLSKLRGTFDQREARVVVVTNGGSFDGLVARKQLMSSHHPPNEAAGNLTIDPPKVQRTEDVREVARLMVENQLKLLPVFAGEEFVGVITAERLLDMVRDNLDVLDVEDVYTRDLIAVDSDATLGEVIHLLREHKITRVPVIDDGSPTGMISVYDMVDFVLRKVDREQGGTTDGFDGHGGEGSRDGHRSHGGFGERSGMEGRLLDLPARDVMSTPVETCEPGDSLADAVGRMIDDDYSSLVVVAPGTTPPETLGIVTKTDALQALTRTEEDHIPVQIFNVDLLDTLSREAIAEKVEAIDGKYEDMAVQEVNVVFHEHEERQRGVPLVQTRIRLFTNRGRFFGTAEEYGAERAFEAASDVLEENVLQEKGRALDSHTRKKRADDPEELERLLGWWVEAG